MNIARHVAVLRRFKGVTIGGVVIGVVLALLASYTVSLNGGSVISPKGEEEWAAISQILVTQPGFPEGRVTLPETAADGGEASRTADGQVEFADPARLSALADLYSRLLDSDEVLSRVPGRPTASRIEASPYQSSAGGLLLPVIQLTATGSSAAAARTLNLNTLDGLRAVLREQQRQNRIPASRRVQLKVITTPKTELVAGRNHTTAILVFLLCLAGTVALAHLLAAVRDKPEDEALASIVDWEELGQRAEPTTSPRQAPARDERAGPSVIDDEVSRASRRAGGERALQ